MLLQSAGGAQAQTPWPTKIHLVSPIFADGHVIIGYFLEVAPSGDSEKYEKIGRGCFFL